jgi:hypothetical protein
MILGNTRKYIFLLDICNSRQHIRNIGKSYHKGFTLSIQYFPNLFDQENDFAFGTQFGNAD